MDGADFQIDALQGAERPFHLGQTFVGADRIPGPDRLLGQARTDDVKAVKPGFGGDFVLFAAKNERATRELAAAGAVPSGRDNHLTS